MSKSSLQIHPGIWLDHRRAVYLEDENLVAVADLHLGYAWAHRFQGQMLPLQAEESLTDRLRDLCVSYKPKSFAILGDIVHQAVPVANILDELLSLAAALSEACPVHFVLGNHDRGLAKLLKNTSLEFSRSLQSGKYLLLHGDADTPAISPESIVLMGHEHPAISLGDGVRSAKFPCFLISENRPRIIILPAFSHWAAGTDTRYHPMMSPLARSVRFGKAVAICGPKLLSVPLNQNA